MALYLVSYSVDGAEGILRQLDQKHIIIFDTRKDPICRDNPLWNMESLRQRFSFYYWAGDCLGNRNHHTGKQIELMHSEPLLSQIASFLTQGAAAALLCVCRDERCHNRLIAQMLQAQVPELVVRTLGRMTPYEQI